MDHSSDHHAAVLGLRIIQACPDQLDQLVPLFEGYRKHYGAKPDPEGARAFLLDRMADLQSVVYLAIGSQDEGPEEAMGFVQLYPGYSSVSMCRVWNLHDVYVSHSARGAGVGHALIDKARHLAEHTGAAGLVTSFRHHNVGAQKLFRSTGFIHDDEFEYYFLPVEDVEKLHR